MDWYQRYDASLVDAALLLTLWRRCAVNEETLGSRTRLMKLAYLAARRCAESGQHYFSLEFHQWKYGPNSPGVVDAWNRLQQAGYLEEEECWEITERGSELADELYRELIGKEDYGSLRFVIDELAAKWATISDDMSLSSHIRHMPLGANGSGSVGDAELLTTLIAPPRDDLPMINLDSEASWVETLALSFSPQDLARLQRAVEDFRAGRFHVA